MRRVAWVLSLVVGCGGASTTAPTAAASGREECAVGERCVEQQQLLIGTVQPGSDLDHALSQSPAMSTLPPPVPLPATRSEHTPSTAPDLAVAESAYARLFAAPIALSVPPPDADSGSRALVANITAASLIATEVISACQAAGRRSPDVAVEAAVLIADTCDVLAAHVASAGMPLPLDLEQRVATESDDVRQAVHVEFARRFAAAIRPQVQRLFCAAADAYRALLEIDPANARAHLQRGAYGAEFLASCPATSPN